MPNKIKYISLLLLLVNTLLFSNQLSQKELDFNLIRYSYIGDIQKVKEYHKKGAKVDKYKGNSSALSWAVFKDNVDIAKYLINHKASINMTSFSGRNILHYAVQNNNFELTKYLIKNGVKLKDRNSGHDILFEAVKNGNLALVKYLLPLFKYIDRYYLIFTPHRDVRTSLLITAIQNDNIEIAKYLIKNGANINLSNNRGETPILTAMRNKHFELARYIIDKGANLKAQDIAGNNTLTYAITSKQEDIALKALKYIDINQWVASNIFDGKSYIYEEYISETKKQWQFASYLHLASRYGQTKVIKELLKSGLDIETLSRDKKYPFSALQYAIYFSDIKTVKFLIKNGADSYIKYNSPLPWGSYKTLLSYTMQTANTTKNKQEIIKYLLSLPNSTWYKQSEDMKGINKFLAKKSTFKDIDENERLEQGIKTNDYRDVIYATKKNDKLVYAVKEMLKLNHNINNELFKKYDYKGTLLLEYFQSMESNINIEDIKQLVKLEATLGDSYEALNSVYQLYSNSALEFILTDDVFKIQMKNLHQKYDLTNIAISVYKNKRRSNHRIEKLFEYIYKYNLKFDFDRFRAVIKKDDEYIHRVVKFYDIPKGH